MEITNKNFEKEYPSIKEKIFSSTFIAFDEEMTGIQSYDHNYKIHKTDTPENRYLKMKFIASKYSIVQFGLCLFHEQSDGSILMSPYTFYLFPQSGSDMSLNISAIHFLKQNHFNFQKWIHDGISYVDKHQDDYLFKKYNQNQSSKENSSNETNDITTISTSEVKLIELTKLSDIEYMDHNINNLMDMMDNPNENEYIFQYSNSYLRKAVYQYLDMNYNQNQSRNILITKTDDNRIKVTKITCENQIQENYEQLQLMYSTMIGFRQVFKDLIEAKKPLVGHNCGYDILFMMKSFECPLQHNINEFKSFLSRLFPLFYDTKFISSSYDFMNENIPSTALNDLYQKYSTPYSTDESKEEEGGSNRVVHEQKNKILFGREKLKFAPGFDVEEQAHDAGYDAYCTGYLFICLLHQYYHHHPTSEHNSEHPSLSVMLTDIEGLMGNKLFMMQSLYHMDLDPNHSNGWIKIKGIIFHLSNFPSTSSTDDIKTCLCNMGYSSECIDISWIDGTSCLICLDGVDENQDHWMKISENLPNGWRLHHYDDFITGKFNITEEDGTLNPELEKGDVETVKRDLEISEENDNKRAKT